MSWVSTLKIIHQTIHTHARTHYVVIIFFIAMLTLCYFIMPHATQILYYHAYVLTM
jgi:hypothetical protein